MARKNIPDPNEAKQYVKQSSLSFKALSNSNSSALEKFEPLDMEDMPMDLNIEITDSNPSKTIVSRKYSSKIQSSKSSFKQE